MERRRSQRRHSEVGPTAAEVLEVKRRIVRTAAGMEAGQIELFEGCRMLADLRLGLDDESINDSDLAVFQTIDSELDNFPFGPSREHWEPGFLAQKDAQKAAYLERVRDWILTTCQTIRIKWSGTVEP